MSAARTASLPTIADIERRLQELAPDLAQHLPFIEHLAEAPGSAEDPEDPHNDGQEPEDTEGPPILAPAALHGIAGQILRTLAPHTEADPAALLLQVLAVFGNLAGPAPHVLVGPTRHGLNLFVVLVGDTSKARKGSSWRLIESLFSNVDLKWVESRIMTSPPAPTAIFDLLRDRQPPTDRRLLLLAEEFASVLSSLGRQSGRLSTLLRCAWDGGNLAGNDSHHRERATAAHISLVGHIQHSDLALHLGRNEVHNGFANRCLWASVHRSQSLPHGGMLPVEQSVGLARELSRSLQWTIDQSELVFRRTDDANVLWSDSYSTLSRSRPDVYGAVTGRAEAQVLRLSALYAALDATSWIDTCHLQAALAVWDYCQSSARLFFDHAPIDAIASRINKAIGASGAGLSKTQIRALFHGHVSTQRIDHALDQLTTLGLIGRQTHTIQSGRGRRATLWGPENRQAANE